MDSFSRIVSPVQPREDDSWSSGSSMDSISRIVSPVQPREDDSWSSGSSMDSFSRIVSPVHPREDDSWSSGTTMHSINRVVSPVQPREDDSWTSGATTDSISRIVSPVQPREDDSWSSGTTMDSIRVEAAANLTCPSVEEVEEEEEFGCFGPHSTRLKGAAKALAKAVEESMNPKIILSLLGFKVVSFLGEGSYGKIYLASSKSYLNNVAIKVMDRSQMSPTAEKFLTRELEIIKYLDHPYIVQVYEVHETPQGLIFIVMEAAMMDLRQMIVELNYFPVDLAKAVFSQLVSAVVYLHEQDIVHRDLKSENILLTGFPELRNSLCGTPNYCAPEVLCGKSYDGKKSDVWSLGVILYTMVTGELPFNYENILYLQKKPLQYSIPVEKSCRDFISYMLQYDPFTRPSVTEVAHCFALLAVKQKDLVAKP
uniref:non-specific serine/threonine protein kinase n=1 Tax=Astyanax mexicanus TaxID=7994 RepID=A0A3B1J366_ASTMX